MRRDILVKVFATSIGVLVITITLTLWNPLWWQNIKLSSTQYWGYATLTNNPLLGTNQDLSDANSNQVVATTPRVNPERLRSGGVPKDGIPSIDNPQFEPIDQTDFGDDELIIGLVHNGVARAYPYAILNWHEIVNDTIGGTPVAVTYCPLCETNSVFVRELEHYGLVSPVEFGVSGQLLDSCLVMYDRTTDSLYSQAWGTGIVGSQTNTVLERLPAARTTIGRFRQQYPQAEILTTETGHNADYSGYPYGTYYTDKNLIFMPRNLDQLTVHPKTITSVIFESSEQVPQDYFSGYYLALTHDEIRDTNPQSFVFAGREITVSWNNTLGTVEFTNPDDSPIPSMAAFGFVVPAHFAPGD